MERCDTVLSLDYDGLEGFDFTFHHTHKFSEIHMGILYPFPVTHYQIKSQFINLKKVSCPSIMISQTFIECLLRF